MAIQTIKVPDIGGAEGVEVIEISVKVGDVIAENDSILVLETDKASMEIPASVGGKVVAIKVNLGDKVSEGSALIEVEAEGAGVATSAAAPAPVAAPAAAPAPQAAAPAAAPAAASSEVTLSVPDIGGAEAVEVIEISVKVGDEVAQGDSLIVLETDKASMEIPAETAGKILSIAVKVGDKVSQGAAIAVVASAGGAPAPAAAPATAAPAPAKVEAAPAPAAASTPAPKAAAVEEVVQTGDVYAGPAVRKLARQLGVDLGKVSGSGPRSRLLKDDVRNYVKPIVQAAQSGASFGGSGVPALPVIDYSKFGEIEIVKMSKIKKLTADAMTRSWLNVPRITQFDDADITDLEAFRNSMKAEAEKRGSKLTPLPFIVKAVAAALVAEPSFNVSVHQDNESIVHKKFVHIGIAVDTPNGLLVPVVRNADKKGLFELADEINVLAKKAREGKLTPAEMQGGCFTISSLGAMGGNGFTPMVSAPTEVGILGVSRAQMKPVWNGKEFIPRNMLPLSLSYDHRAVNGADAGRFMTYLTGVIGDLRRLLL
ncbi:acetyltransferase component of pyruvate dehydrogenase complex [Cellvibrio zantedeschiae]|uniref:Acetyltransferase component of pyruvate dehydrogenase complex n=1 Tax=Cellvibrio zantedeschiae TaxID=1237077 RepID=A0ABQ3AWH7_9GAMM|nr:dihydrolipoyllysine-residue acetyltransferase [Cellvibrio zantedeschiae]GGY66075.1 acetyltransferase component of pyruvate dehydrogenase complex [Cellvibrio zantedeschiae]